MAVWKREQSITKILRIWPPNVSWRVVGQPCSNRGLVTRLARNASAEPRKAPSEGLLEQVGVAFDCSTPPGARANIVGRHGYHCYFSPSAHFPRGAGPQVLHRHGHRDAVHGSDRLL